MTSEPPLICNVQSSYEPRFLSTVYSSGIGTLFSGCGLAGKSYAPQRWRDVATAGGSLELDCESTFSVELTLDCWGLADILIT